MKISIETYELRERYDDKTSVKMLKDAGFDCYDYSMYWIHDKSKDMLEEDYRERAVALRKFADNLGIECNQAHAPFDLEHTDSFDLSNETYRKLVRSLEVASILGAKNIVVHAIGYRQLSKENFYQLNRQFYKSLLPYCEQFDICVSVENLFDWKEKALPVLSDPKEHMEFVKSLDSDRFNICVDVGHSAVTGFQPEEVIGAMNQDILKALHIQDNDCFMDLHTIPFAGKLDWSKIATALKTIGYEGDWTFEVWAFLNKLPADSLPSALHFIADLGKSLSNHCQ